jgi:alkylhydroperoxidase/carboxymuconolactone decarboxylase family protein YurZ
LTPQQEARAHAAERYQPGYAQRYETIADLDAHMAMVWSDYLQALLARPGLDTRTRLLVLTGQYAMTGNTARLRETIQASIASAVDLKEVLEVIFHSMIYGGEARMTAAVQTFVEEAGQTGLLDDVRARAVDWPRLRNERSEGQERTTWAEEDAHDSRTPGLLDRYGWERLSPGFRLRPKSHINQIATLDLLDTDFARDWLDAIYVGMYMRGVLDDRTRILCMVGNCLSIGESIQLKGHIRGAIEQGASPAEVLEVILQSCVIVGHPYSLGPGIDTLVEIVDGMGRLGELTDSPDQLLAAVRSRRPGVRSSDSANQ